MKGKGTVYIMTNPAYSPDILKIGMTRRNASIRADELYVNSTGVPEKFVVAHEFETSNCIAAEEIIHKSLDNFRLNNRREFFRISLAKAIDIVKTVVEQVNILYSQSLDDIIRDSETVNPEISREDCNKSSENNSNKNRHSHEKNKSKKDNDYKTQNTSKEHHFFERTRRVNVLCVDCDKGFNLTLTRYENQAACPTCGFTNKLSMDW